MQVVEDGRNWVHTTVVDDATGQPMPCRVHFRSPHGVPYQPHGHHGHVNSNIGTWHIDVGGDLRLGQITYAYIDGTLPGLAAARRGDRRRGARLRVRAAARSASRSRPGQRRLELRLKRWPT